MAANSNIARTSDEMHQRRVACYNIANAVRDEKEMPLAPRIPLIIDVINHANLDAIILLEAGRSSGGKTWSRMAAEIEEGTGLEYMGIYLVNATQAPFGKALFIRRATMAVKTYNRAWIGKTLISSWGGDGYGSDVVMADLYPVIDGKVVVNQHINLWAAHFPMRRDARLDASRALRDALTADTIVMGDFNVFENDGGPEMIDIITSRHGSAEHWKEVPIKELYTFDAFVHDVNEIPASNRHSLPVGSTIVFENPEKGTIGVRFVGKLDRVFAHSNVMVFGTETYFSDPKASDHALVVVNYVCAPIIQ
jgi:hypothetical protein